MGGTVTARDIIIATGSVPFVPPGIPIDGKTVRFCCRSLLWSWAGVGAWHADTVLCRLVRHHKVRRSVC